MVQTVQAIYENGVLHPLQPIEGLAEHCRVKVTVEVEDGSAHPLSDCVGILPDEDAKEMLNIIRDEFNRKESDHASLEV